MSEIRSSRARHHAFTNEINEAIRFYDTSYDFLLKRFIVPGRAESLGGRETRVCRFCGRREPEVSFRSKAHAIPEMLGNKTLFMNYECDSCNQHFGTGIENNLAAWSKPNRTLYRIRGKSGVPKTKKVGSENGWRIENDTSLRITDYASDPVAKLDQQNKQITLTPSRDPYTPIAVLKALVKIGLAILPESEIGNFRETIEWIRSLDHDKPFISNWPTYHTLQPGPMVCNLITVAIMRRKSSVTDVPYAFCLLGFGNDLYQIFLPCPQQDKVIHAREIFVPPFPTPATTFPSLYGNSHARKIDLCGRKPIHGDPYEVRMGFTHMEPTRHPSN